MASRLLDLSGWRKRGVKRGDKRHEIRTNTFGGLHLVVIYTLGSLFRYCRQMGSHSGSLLLFLSFLFHSSFILIFHLRYATPASPGCSRSLRATVLPCKKQRNEGWTVHATEDVLSSRPVSGTFRTPTGWIDGKYDRDGQKKESTKYLPG